MSLITLAFGTLAAATAPAQQPNILLILTDQQTAGAMSCAGNPDIRTPNMDRLAAAGVRMTEAYCSAPLSGPSRAAMMTGLYADGIGMIRNGAEFPEDLQERTLGRRLSEAGYTCAYGGKWHVGPQLSVPQWSGFERIHPYGDPGLAEAAVRWLLQGHDSPFFLVASFVNPHNICEWARGQNLPFGNIPEPELKNCPSLPTNFRRNKDEADILRREQAANYSLYPTENFTRKDWRRYRNAYYRLVEKVDVEIGKIVDAVDSLGLWEDTVMIFTSDHGDGAGAHGWNQKSALYEEVTCVPLIVVLPGRKHGGQTRNQLISTGVDIYATLLDLAGIEPDCDGTSFRSVVEDNTPGQELIVTETTFDRGTTRGWMLRTPTHKYILYDQGKNREQLFDMRRDRLERHNLAADPRCRDILQLHRNLLAAWFEAHDVRPTRANISDIPGKPNRN